MADSTERVAVITGAGSGIGRAVAVRLANAGYRLALLGRREKTLAATAALCGGRQSLAIACDVSYEAQVEDAFARVVSSARRIDLLFNNAGNFPEAASFQDVDFAAWRSIFDVNVHGAFLCARAAFRQMARQEPSGGRIINNGSLSAHTPRPKAAAYTVSKHAITGLTKAILLAGRNLDIVESQIDIGNAATDLTAGLAREALQADGSSTAEAMMDAAQVADAIAMLANLPLGANIPFMTIMATRMPFVGRG